MLLLSGELLRGGRHVAAQHVEESCGPFVLHHAPHGGSDRTPSSLRSRRRFHPRRFCCARSPHPASALAAIHQRLLLHSHARLLRGQPLRHRGIPRLLARIRSARRDRRLPGRRLRSGRGVLPSFNPRGSHYTQLDYELGFIHTAFAALMYLVLSYICIFLFRKSSPEKHFTPRKRDRNRIYATSGLIMVACMIDMVGLTIRSLDRAASSQPLALLVRSIGDLRLRRCLADQGRRVHARQTAQSPSCCCPPPRRDTVLNRCGGEVRNTKNRYVNRAKRRETSGKSTPLTNQQTAPQATATSAELAVTGVNACAAGLGIAVNTAPTTKVKAAIHW